MKRIITLMLALVLAVGMFSACGSKTIKSPYSAEECGGKAYLSVMASLQSAGFTNISTVPVEDLELVASDKDGSIESVSIGGNSSFTSDDEFSPASVVVISYHSMKTVVVPLSSTDAVSKSLEEIAQLFTDAGFSNVTTKEEYDLDPDTVDVDYKTEVSIGGVSAFENGDKYPINSTVSVVCHIPYEKYTVQMHIDFIPNLIFSKYNVDLLLDDVKQNTLEHGIDADYSFRLKEGTYTFTFANAESSSVKGETTIDVKSDVDASYKIFCYSDKVSIETDYLDVKNALGENEAKIMSSEYDFIGVNYVGVVSALKELGFTNIIEVQAYDIYFGITAEGSTKDVSISDSDDYKRGDVYAKDVEIVVTYSMSYEKKPANQAGEPTPSIQPSTTPSTPAVTVNFAEESAFRAAVVAFTNMFADDIFTADGSNYDLSKLHSYDDLSGFYMDVTSRGNWTGKSENTWHVEHLKLRVPEYGSTVDASLDVSYDGSNYLIFNLAGKAPSHDDNDSNFSSMKDLEDESQAFLTIAPYLIDKDRSVTEVTAQTQTPVITEHYPSGISSWDGDHTGLKKLIKVNMNDEGSYKHINTTWVYVADDSKKKEIDNILSNAGYSESVSIGDFFIVTEFSCKNPFNATVKNTAFGIEYKDGSVKLLAIE